MSFFRSERVAALLLAAAAIAALIVANTAAGPAVQGFFAVELGPSHTPWRLTLGEWVEDGLLAVFFLIAAIELRHEFTNGELRTPAKALRPAIAAVGGVVVPILVYLAIAAPAGQPGGWPVPTATDVAFALGVLAIASRGLLPQRIRAFLLALAIIDDLIGIVLIAVVFAHGFDAAAAGVAVLAVLGIVVLSRLLLRHLRRDGRMRPHADRALIALVSVAGTTLGVVAWAATAASGIHPTIAGVAVGLALPPAVGHVVRQVLEPVVNVVVLPLFAFVASLVAIPRVAQLAAAFWGIAVALPAGKLAGIAGATWAADRMVTRRRRDRFGALDLATLGALGGIGFTVSLLMASLAFAGDRELADEAILGVLAGSAVSVALAVTLVSVQAARVAAVGRLRQRVIARR